MGKIFVYAVRHAEGFHNLDPMNHDLKDPDLTVKGMDQCAKLRASFPFHKELTHLVASPLRRTLYTALLTFSEPTADAKSVKLVHALPEVQETSNLPCDTGSNPVRLEAEFKDPENAYHDQVDLGLVQVGWNHKGPGSKWSPAKDNLEKRAKESRKWLRELGQKYDGDAHIAVVTHGGFLHYFTEDWSGHTKFTGTGWANTEWRAYEFESEDDAEASLKETKGSISGRHAKPLTKDEQRNLKAVAEGSWQKSGFQAPAAASSSAVSLSQDAKL